MNKKFTSFIYLFIYLFLYIYELCFITELNEIK